MFGFDAQDVVSQGVKVDERHVPVSIRRLERHIDSNYAAENDAVKVVSDIQFVCWRLLSHDGRWVAVMLVSTSKSTSTLAIYEGIPPVVWSGIESSLPETEMVA